jgi:hypothetical protein
MRSTQDGSRSTEQRPESKALRGNRPRRDRVTGMSNAVERPLESSYRFFALRNRL